jgi:hypothetical protein
MLPKPLRIWIIQPPKRWAVALSALCGVVLLMLATRLIIAWIDPVMFTRWDSLLSLVGHIAAIMLILGFIWVAIRHHSVGA